jgi:hypothetical protein
MWHQGSATSSSVSPLLSASAQVLALEGGYRPEELLFAVEAVDVGHGDEMERGRSLELARYSSCPGNAPSLLNGGEGYEGSRS